MERDTGKRDRLFAEGQETPTEFIFDERVAQVFPDMINRSVPGYATVISMTGVLASEYMRPNSRCYDLGCSLGASSLAVRSATRAEGCQIVAVDNSQAMLSRARANLEKAPEGVPIQLVCADIRDVLVENASMVLLNFTLQFLPTESRAPLLRKIKSGLNPGGVLVLSEKIAFESEQEEALQTEMHHAFKHANGYERLEISRKRSALEQVLIPETLDVHLERLKQAGFSSTHLWFQCFNFVSLIARP